MYPVRKQVPVNTVFPFEFVFRDTKMPQGELPDHWHDWWEIVYVYSGRGTFLVDHLLLEMQVGDLFFIPGNTVHRAMPNQDNPVTSTAIFFDPEILEGKTFGNNSSYPDILEQQRKLKVYKYSLKYAQQIEVENHLSTIRNELIHEKFGSFQAIILELQMMLLQLSRSVFLGAHESSESFGPEWLHDVLMYIENHLMEPISLDMLAKTAQVSPSHLSRVFKQLTGLTVVEYILSKRLARVKEELLNTNDKVHIIASNCGFDNLPYFHRTFKKYIGTTPSAYRSSQFRRSH